MSFKYQHLLLSTCFTAIGFVSLPANAGFEWTPPKEEIKAPAAITEDLPPVVIAEDLVPILSDEVLSDEIIPVVTDVAQEDGDIILDELVIEEKVIEVEEDIALDQVIVEPQGDVEADIDLFPISSGNENTVEASDIVILSSDSDDDMSEAVVIEDEVTVVPNDDITWNETQSFDVIEGFGTDMPLALALSQIVPAKYAYSFGNDVNPGALISWNGGKPWNEVLKDALSLLNVGFEIKGKKIILNSDAPAVDPIIEKEAAVDIFAESEVDMAKMAVKKKLKIS